MKKVAMFGLFLALTAMTGCHKDGNSLDCNADSFLMHCEEGNVVSCVLDFKTHEGVLHLDASFVHNDVVYVCKDGEVVIDNQCDGNDLVLQNGDKVESVCGFYGTVACYNGHASENVMDKCDGSQDYPAVASSVKCADGVLMVMGESDYVAYGKYMCDQNSGNVFHCDADRLVKHAAFCDDSSAVMCSWDGAAWNLDKSDCGANETCVEYEKGNAKYAACFDNSNVGDSCGSINVYGSCDGDNLVVCSSNGEDGRLLRIDCAAQGAQMGVTRKCGLIEDSTYGYDCKTVCNDEGGTEYDEFGTCTDAGVLHYCNQKGEYATPIDCSAQSKSCSWDRSYDDFDCI